MKFKAIAAAAFLVLGTAGSAMADRSYDNDSLASVLGEDVLTGLLDDYKDGTYNNLSVNTGNIDASVQIEAGDDVQIGGREIKVEGELDFDLEQDTGVTTTVNVDLSGVAGSSIKTVAVGAMNEGTVDVAGVSFSSESEFTRTETDIELAVELASESRDRRDHAPDMTAELEGAMETESFNRTASLTRDSLPEVSIMNLAYNTGDVNASVQIDAGYRDDVELSNLAISTTAIGAINTGAITIGNTTK